MNGFLNFDQFLTPKIIKIVYILGLIMVLLSGLGTLTTLSYTHNFFFALIVSGLWMVLGALSVRILCELYIIFFKIHDQLAAIKDNQVASQNNQAASHPVNRDSL